MMMMMMALRNKELNCFTNQPGKDATLFCVLYSSPQQRGTKYLNSTPGAKCRELVNTHKQNVNIITHMIMITF